MKKYIISIILLGAFAILMDYGVTSNKSETNKCLLNDTIIKKLTFGINKYEFLKYTSLKEYNWLEVNENKLWLEFKPHFYSDQLFSLSVDVSTSENTEPVLFNNERRSMEQDYWNWSLFEHLIEIYYQKYGTPTHIESSGRKGSWHTENIGPGFIEFMDFEIHKKIEWSCSNKFIKLEFDIESRIDSDMANSNITEDKILQDKSYQERFCKNFNILYEDLQLKSQHDQAVGKKVQSKMRIEDSLKKANDKKLKEAI